MQNHHGCDLTVVRTLLCDAFTNADLRRFCQDFFTPLTVRFGPNDSVEEMIDEIIDYCGTRDLWAEFLGKVADTNPRQFAPYAPILDIVAHFTPTSYSPPPLPDLTTLPEPGGLPPGSRLPFARNDLFTGREVQLTTLAQVLLSRQGQKPELVTQAVLGMGGVGKTQLAVEFAYRYGRYFHGVHWLNATQPDLLSAEIAACGKAMMLRSWPREQPAQVSATLRAWAADAPRLVIADNLEDMAAMRVWWTALREAGVRLLVTARRTGWPRDLGLERLRLEVFAPAESREFLRRWLGNNRAADDELDALAQRLGHLPLALELAGRYLDGQQWLKVNGYLARLGDVLTHPSLAGWMEEMGSPTGHDLDVARSFALSWGRVTEVAARRVFRVAGWCAPSSTIPHTLLAEAASLDEATCGEALAGLVALGLMEGDMAGVAIHPLLGVYARTLGGEEGFAPLKALARALAAQAEEANQVGLPMAFAPLRMHVEVVVRAAETAGLEETGRLWNSLGYHLWMVVEYPGARAAFEQALAQWQQHLGPENEFVATALNNLGMVLQDVGDLPGASAAYGRALRICEQHLGADHPDVATIINNLGLVLQGLGELPRARDAFERALGTFENHLGADHPNVATLLNNLGLVLKDLGALADARVAYERAQMIDEAAFGTVHPSVARDINNLGGVLKALGDLNEARAAYERALTVDEAVFGPMHPNVARDVNNLGVVLKDIGDLAGARMAYERALAIDETSLGPMHPNVAIEINNIGMVLQSLGDLAGARAAFERALSIFEALLPTSHPATEIVRQNLESVRRVEE